MNADGPLYTLNSQVYFFSNECDNAEKPCYMVQIIIQIHHFLDQSSTAAGVIEDVQWCRNSVMLSVVEWGKKQIACYFIEETRALRPHSQLTHSK